MDLDLILRGGLVLLALVGAPLALGCVPPNAFYGVRTPKTLASRDVWFAVNRWAGTALFLGAVVALLWMILAPERMQVGPLSPSAHPLLVVAGSAVAAWVAIRRRE